MFEKNEFEVEICRCHRHQFDNAHNFIFGKGTYEGKRDKLPIVSSSLREIPWRLQCVHTESIQSELAILLHIFTHYFVLSGRFGMLRVREFAHGFYSLCFVFLYVFSLRLPVAVRQRLARFLSESPQKKTTTNRAQNHK